MPTIPPPAPRPSTASITPFAPPARDPNAMEVDATKSRLDWTCMMAGKCYGCGSTQHAKANGNHEHEICGHCGRAGHCKAVCFDKLAGKPKARRVAASENLPAEIPGLPSSELLSSTPGSPTPNFNDMLAQLHQLILEFVQLELTIGDYVEVVELLVTDLGPEEVILGLPWLRKVNPDIDWRAGLMNIKVEEEEEVKEDGAEVEE
uniref:Putative retrotransposon n=1 Tax=Moniliophthora roreri TaxID=221103 RepID=A0A0W0GF89_MONRR